MWIKNPPAAEAGMKPTSCLHPDDRAASLTRLWVADIIALCQGVAQIPRRCRAGYEGQDGSQLPL